MKLATGEYVTTVLLNEFRTGFISCQFLTIARFDHVVNIYTQCNCMWYMVRKQQVVCNRTFENIMSVINKLLILEVKPFGLIYVFGTCAFRASTHTVRLNSNIKFLNA